MKGQREPGSIEEDLEKFVEKLKETPEYKLYREKAEQVHQNEELKARLDEYRQMNYCLQQEMDPYVVEQKTAELERFNEEIIKDSLASDFLDAETAFCRLMQDVSVAIFSSLDFE